LEKEIAIDGTCYDFVGAVYGDGYHFIFRYHHNGKVYEADGMAKYPTSNHHRKIRAALSKEIHGSYESSLARHIGCKLNAEKMKVDGKKIVDVYYTKRQIKKFFLMTLLSDISKITPLAVPGCTSLCTRVPQDVYNIK
jgi:hypothetical protein